MIFIDKMKNFKIYKTPMFLPTLENDKKKKSAILLMTPNYASSKKLLDNPLFINKLRYSSYYIEKDVSYYINSKGIKEVDNNPDSYVESATELTYYQNLLEMTAAQKAKLKDSDFGLPDKRKYPLDTPGRVRSAVKFFNYVSKEDEAELAKNIIKAIKKFDINISVGEKNRLSKYYKGTNESAILESQSVIPENTPDNPIYSVSAIIRDKDGRVLLEDHVKNDAFTFPGGKVDPGETPEEAIRRECYEELGIEVVEMNESKDNPTLFCIEYPVKSGKWYYFKDYNFNIIQYKGTISNKEPHKHRSLQYMHIADIIPSNLKVSRLVQLYISNRYKDFNHNGLEDGDGIKIRPSDFTFSADFDNAKILSRLCTVENYISILKFLNIDILKKEDIPHTHLYISNSEYDDCEVENGRLKVNVGVLPFKTDYNDNLTLEENYRRYAEVVEAQIIEAIIKAKYPSTRQTAIPMMYSHTFLGFDDYYTATYNAVYKETDGNVSSMLGIGDVSSIVKIAHKHNIPITMDTFDANAYDMNPKIGDLYTESMDLIYESMSTINREDNKFANYNYFGLEYNTDYRLQESSINCGDKIIFFNEDAKNDTQLRRLIYNNRLKKRADVLLLYDQVKKDFPFIKYTFPEIQKYAKKNLFVDLYYYNNVFFENNTWVQKKGMNLYLDFMNRLINNPVLDEAGYEKKTIFIPISDWDTNRNGTVWNYKTSLNPLSVLYQLLYTGDINGLKRLFGNNNVVFVGTGRYFKINFSELDPKEVKHFAVKFKMFLIKICKNEEFDESDMESNVPEDADTIKANIVDKIELSKGVDLTKQVAKAKKDKDNELAVGIEEPNKSKATKNKTEEPVEDKDDKVISKATLSKSDNNNSDEKDINDLARAINNVADDSKSEEEALDNLDNDYIKGILMDLDSKEEDKVNISLSRTERMNSLSAKLLDSKVKNKSIRDILNEKPEELKPVSLDIATVNEEWKDLKYTNFDKNYDIDKDIINCFKHFEHVSRPIVIRNIEVTDNSTSEDRLELYKVEMEDYRGKRFTVKLDIPTMVDNRFKLRGYYKSIQTQYFNMPIIKTDFDTCQIISNYMKIFVKRFGTGSGKSLPITGKFLKACNKYNHRDIKFVTGDNAKVSSKYSLPIDYIDIGTVYSRIETEDFIIYFNQDEIRNLYNIDDTKGVPFAYNKKNKEISYYSTKNNASFTSEMLYLFEVAEKYKEFIDLVYSMNSPSICTYSRASIMNSKIPLVVICAYHEGLRKTMDKAGINYHLSQTLSKEDRHNIGLDWIKFDDGYVIFESNYESSLLMNGLKACPTDMFKLEDIDSKNMYLEFLDNFGGRIKADGLDNFYDCMVDPITEEVLKFYNFPTDYISILIYANNLLADNKFIKHTNSASRRFRRYELIAVYTYKVLADTYASYSTQLKHNREAAEFSVKQSAVIDKFLTDSITGDDSCINPLYDLETTNSITTKGPSGMNSDRAYNVDKRGYDDSMLNVLGMSTGFAANVGITRQATVDANIEGERGYVKNINGDTDKMNSAKTLTATEALVPFGTTRDDPFRTAMTFIQTAKHMVRTEDSDPLLVTNGCDEAMPYLSSDRFAYKAKKDGKIIELEEDHIMVEYNDGTKDYINLTETIEKNSDGGYYVPLKLDAIDKLKVGSKVKENQLLAYDKYSYSNSLGEDDNLAYNIGKLAKVAVVNTDEGFEDSGIITESMAKKLATRIDLKFDIVLDKDSLVYSIGKVGDHVECGDNLLVWQSPFEDEDANSLLKVLSDEDVSELGKRKLTSEVTGTITGINIYRTVEVDELSESLQKIVKAYEKPLIALEKKFKENNLDISTIPAHYKLEATGKLKKAQDAVLIEFFVEYLDTVGIGDKVVYYSANKATEKTVIPEGKEPYTEFRPNEPIDAFVSETSIDKRMVGSSIIYGSLQKLMIELDRSVKDILGIPYDDSTV